MEHLLAAHEQAGDFLEAPVQPAPKPMFGDQAGETQALPDSGVAIERVGSMIGRYKLLEQIGESAAEVLARQYA